MTTPHARLPGAPAEPLRAAVRPPPAGAWLVPAVLAATMLLTAVVYPLTSPGTLRDVVSWTIVLLGSAVSVTHAWVSRGARTGLGLLGVVAAVAVVFEAVGLSTGVPYGTYTYSDQLGPTLLGVPFLVPLAWLMMAWPSWVVAARLTTRRPARVLGAAYVFAAWDVLLDPQMVDAGYWTWAHPSPGLPGIETVPLTNLAGWLLAGLVLMTLVDLLVSRTARPARTGDVAPLMVLAWMTLGGALAHVGWLGLPGSAAWGVVLALPVLAVVAVRARRARTATPPGR